MKLYILSTISQKICMWQWDVQSGLASQIDECHDCGISNTSHQPTFMASSLLPNTAPLKYSAYAYVLFMAPNTTPTKCAKIFTMKAAGFSNNEIQAALTGCHDLSDCQILWIFNRYREGENYYKVGHSMSHPWKLTPWDVWVSWQHLSNQTAHNTSDLQHQYFLNVSVDTK